jgi:hypothetical protein
VNFALITKIAAAITGAAAAATLVVALVPAPFVENGIWLDQPIPNAQLQPGPVTVSMHASNSNVAQFRIVIRKDGKTVKVLNDTSVTTEKSGILFAVLSSGSVEWQGTAGIYTIEPRYLAQGSWITGETATVSVTGADGALPVTEPSASPTSTPTATTTPDPTETEAPIVDGEPGPVTPSATSTPPPVAEPQMPTGTLQRNSQPNGHQSSYTVTSITPEFVDVDVQVRSRTSGSWSSWSSLGCSDLVPDVGSTVQNPYFRCQVASHTWGWSTAGREAQVRVVITSFDDASLVYTSGSSTWTILPDIG